MPRGPPARTAKIVGHEAWTQPEETTTLSPNHPVNRPVCKRTGLESDTRDGVETSDCGFVPCCGRFGVLHLFQSLENAASIESPTCLLFTWRTLFFFFSLPFLFVFVVFCVMVQLMSGPCLGGFVQCIQLCIVHCGTGMFGWSRSSKETRWGRPSELSYGKWYCTRMFV